jgi:ribosomal protein S27AE
MSESAKAKLKGKTLCKLVKNDVLEKHFDAYATLVANARYLCGKCGRVSLDADRLCKPKRLPVVAEETESPPKP